MQKLNNYITKTAAAVAASFEKEAAAAAAKAAAAKAAKANTEEATEAAEEAEAKAKAAFEKAEAAAEEAKEEKAEAAAMIAAAEAEKERIRKEAEEAAAAKAAAEAKAEAAAEAKAKANPDTAAVLESFEKVLKYLHIAKDVNLSRASYISEGLQYSLNLYAACKFKTPLYKLLEVIKYAGKVKSYLDSIGIVVIHNAKSGYMQILIDDAGSFSNGEYESFKTFSDSLPKEKKKIDYQKRLKNLFTGLQPAEIRAAINEYLRDI